MEIEENIIEWVFQKHSHLCTRLGRSKNNEAKPKMKKKINTSPTQRQKSTSPTGGQEVEQELNI